MVKFILSFGGGVNSTALYFLIREKKLQLDEVIFADTGDELPNTYKVISQFKELIEKDGIPFMIVRSEIAKNLYNYCYEKRILPSRQRRDCTTKFKISPIRKYLRSKYGKDEKFVQYIGIALEEFSRMRKSDVSYIELKYPLIDYEIDRAGCIRILELNGITDVEKSGCFFCPFTKKAGWNMLLLKYPELYERAVKLEKNCPNKKVLLSYKSLESMGRTVQKNLNDVEITCDIAVSCFL